MRKLNSQWKLRKIYQSDIHPLMQMNAQSELCSKADIWDRIQNTIQEKSSHSLPDTLRGRIFSLAPSFMGVMSVCLIFTGLYAFQQIQSQNHLNQYLYSTLVSQDRLAQLGDD